MTKKKDVIEELREARAASKMSVRATSEITGVIPSQISRIERRLASPTLDTLERLAGAYGKAVTLKDRE